LLARVNIERKTGTATFFSSLKKVAVPAFRRFSRGMRGMKTVAVPAFRDLSQGESPC
jgi:hypothetical protein